jgi:hypothetical protein
MMPTGNVVGHRQKVVLQVPDAGIKRRLLGVEAGAVGVVPAVSIGVLRGEGPAYFRSKYAPFTHQFGDGVCDQ